MGNVCQAISNLSNQAWILARMYNQDDQNVPSWAAFHAACGVSEATVTVVGMIPIIQAHADENNTVVTMLNKFQEMIIILARNMLRLSEINLSIAEQNNYDDQIVINMTML